MHRGRDIVIPAEEPDVPVRVDAGEVARVDEAVGVDARGRVALARREHDIAHLDDVRVDAHQPTTFVLRTSGQFSLKVRPSTRMREPSTWMRLRVISLITSPAT